MAKILRPKERLRMKDLGARAFSYGYASPPWLGCQVEVVCRPGVVPCPGLPCLPGTICRLRVACRLVDHRVAAEEDGLAGELLGGVDEGTRIAEPVRQYGQLRAGEDEVVGATPLFRS